MEEANQKFSTRLSTHFVDLIPLRQLASPLEIGVLKELVDMTPPQRSAAVGKGRDVSVSTLLRRLERVKDSFGGEAAREKLELLQRLDQGNLPRAKQVFALHEILCFLQAYPDNGVVLELAEKMLTHFGEREDLRKHRRQLEDTGIAGTHIQYPFYWFTARWLAQRWPERLAIIWEEFDAKDRLKEMFHLLLPYSETLALDESDLTSRELVLRLKGAEETDAAFLIRRFGELGADSFEREHFYEELDVPIRLAPGPHTPSRTHTKYRGARVTFQARPLTRARPDLRHAINQSPLAVRALGPGEGQRFIDLARDRKSVV